MRNKLKLRTAHAYNYPIKSGELIGDLIILSFGSFLAGITFLQATVLTDTHQQALFLAITLIILNIVAFNTYRWIYRTVKKYETMYGPSTLGQEMIKDKK